MGSPFGPWRTSAGRSKAEIAVNGLLRAGLIHKTSDGFVFAARAGVRAVQMVGHVI